MKFNIEINETSCSTYIDGKLNMRMYDNRIVQRIIDLSNSMYFNARREIGYYTLYDMYPGIIQSSDISSLDYEDTRPAFELPNPNIERKQSVKEIVKNRNNQSLNQKSINKNAFKERIKSLKDKWVQPC